MAPPWGKRGLSVVELLVATGVLSVVVLSISSLNLQLSKSNLTAARHAQIDVLTRNIGTLVLNNTAWNFTVNQNSPAAGGAYAGGMDCLYNGTPCTVGGVAAAPPFPSFVAAPPTALPFALYNPDGSLFYDGTHQAPNTLNGFTMTGTPCNNYGTSGSGCALSFTLLWAAVCAAGDCIQPRVQVGVTVNYSAEANQAPMPLNTSLYNLVVYR